MMIVVQHIATEAVQIVTSLDGYAEGWAVVANPAPADILTAPYLIEGGALVPDLATAKARQRAIIQAARDAAMQDNVTVPDLPAVGDAAEFQLRASTPAGRGGFDFIMGYVARAEAALLRDDPYVRGFKLADNRTLPFDAGQWVAIGDHIETELQARFARGEVLLARIDAATTLAAIAAVTWSLAD
jgi:hypothetical protein